LGDESLAGRVVVVTGGNSGIGAGVARGCANAGAAVAIWGRRESHNADIVDELRTRGSDADGFVVDVTDEEQVVDALAATVERFGRVDTMVANAGMNHTMPFLDTPTEHFRALVRNNLESVFICWREAARHMVASGEGGALVATSSIAAVGGQVGGEPYTASKAGIEGMTRAVAKELGPHGIRVNTMVPGLILTPIWGPAPERNLADFIAATSQATPVRRWGTPVDFESVGAFLADPSQVFHTGTCIVVDGAYTLA